MSLWKSTTRIGLLGIALVALGGMVCPARGDVPIDVLPDNQVFPRIAGHVTTFDPCPDIYAIVWEDHRDDAGDIYLRAITPDGVPFGIPLLVDGAVGTQRTPAIAKDTTHCEYLIVWEDQNVAEIRGRFVDTSGVFLGPAFDLGPADVAGATPDVAWNPVDDRFLVVWHDTPFDTGSDILGRFVDHAGVIGPVWVIHDGPEQERRAVVAANIYMDEFMVAWDEGNAAPPRDKPKSVFARRLSTDAEPRGPVFPIVCLRPTIAGAPGIAFDSNRAQFLITFTDNRERDLGNRLDIRGQFVSADSVLLDNICVPGPQDNCVDHFSIAGGPAKQLLSPVSFSVSRDSYLVVWQERHPGDFFRVRGIEVDGGTGCMGMLIDISDPVAAGHARRPAVAHDVSENSWFAVWSDSRNPTSDLFGEEHP